GRERWGVARATRFSAWVPIPNGRGRPRAAPCGVGPWDGAQVASQQSPTLRPGPRYCRRPEGLSNGTEQRGEERSPASARLFDRSCCAATRDPSRGANSSRSLDAAAVVSDGGSRPARRCVWSGPDGEEFAPDTSASARVRYRAELLTVTVSGTLRRN